MCLEGEGQRAIAGEPQEVVGPGGKHGGGVGWRGDKRQLHNHSECVACGGARVCVVGDGQQATSLCALPGQLSVLAPFNLSVAPSLLSSAASAGSLWPPPPFPSLIALSLCPSLSSVCSEPLLFEVQMLRVAGKK